MADAKRFAEFAATVAAMGPIAYRYGTCDEDPVLTPERTLAVGVARPDVPEWREVAAGLARDAEPFPRKIEGRPFFREIGLRLVGRFLDKLREPGEWWFSPGRCLTRDGPDGEWEDCSRIFARRPGEPRPQNDHVWPLDLLGAPAEALSDVRAEPHGSGTLVEAQLDLRPMADVLTESAAEQARRVLSAVGPLRVTLDSEGRPTEIAVSNPALTEARWTMFAFEPAGEPPGLADVWARWRQEAGG